MAALDDPAISFSVDHVPFNGMGLDWSASFQQSFPLSGARGHRKRAAEANARRELAEVERVLFHRVMEPLPVREWQVVQEGDRLRVLIVEPRSDVHVRSDVEQSLRSAGVAPPTVAVELATAVTRTPLGKAPLVRADRR